MSASPTDSRSNGFRTLVARLTLPVTAAELKRAVGTGVPFEVLIEGSSRSTLVDVSPSAANPFGVYSCMDFKRHAELRVNALVDLFLQLTLQPDDPTRYVDDSFLVPDEKNKALGPSLARFRMAIKNYLPNAEVPLLNIKDDLNDYLRSEMSLGLLLRKFGKCAGFRTMDSHDDFRRALFQWMDTPQLTSHHVRSLVEVAAFEVWNAHLIIDHVRKSDPNSIYFFRF
ncbi:hypothetical protein HZC07_02335 [Candidatus Micrarchaeota archaeon]|nr:hypothetical protein [Candidatus Micrarchaeota archaeon]